VFAYPGAPLKNITLTPDRGRIKQTGTVHKAIDIPFEIEGTLEATQSGSVRLHADKIASGHIPVKGLLHLFGEDLSRLVNLKGDRGVTVEGDNIILYPDRMLPPPRIDGKVTAVRIQGDRIVLSFDSGMARALNPPYKTGAEHGFSLEGDHISRGMLSRAVIYGSVMGSLCCERFGVERFRTLTRAEIDARFEEFRQFTSF
jgi:hypothetical protein